MTIRKAATVVLLRGEQDFEVFMVRRHGKSGFMAGAHVFPGGVVDASDAEDFARTDGRSALECAKKLRLSQADATAAFVTAVRETFEESGVALGDMKNESAAEDERAALNDGKAFRDVLDELAWTPDLAQLTTISRWITPRIEKRRYDASFFLARVPDDVRAAPDEREVTHGDWMTPDAALRAAEAATITLPPPTMHTLMMLRQFERSSDAWAQLDAQERIPLYAPRFSKEPSPRLVLPKDPSFIDLEGDEATGDDAFAEAEAARDEGPMRFVLTDARWCAE